MKLTHKLREKLWGEDGPYSEVHLIIETRILDDREARKFVIVELNINPLSFEILKKNRKQFKDDLLIQELIDHAEYRGQPFGYITCAFMNEYTDPTVLIEADKHAEYSKKALIKIHKYVMDYLRIKST